MKALVIGAGASIEECLRSGNASPLTFPSIKNFAKIMWQENRPEPFLSDFLHSLGIEGRKPRSDPLAEFLVLEMNGYTNVERFFEFCWEHKNSYHPTAWNDMLYACFTMPITLIMSQKLFENGHGWRKFQAADRVIEKLEIGDLIVSLNYDIIFDMAIENSGKDFGYLPMDADKKALLLAKPHGSINMLVNEQEGTFAFAYPNTFSGATHVGDANLSASILPPRLNKSYHDVPIAKLIIDAASRCRPNLLTFWGVGFTESDHDLNQLYRELSRSAQAIELVNPDASRVGPLEEILARNVNHFSSLDSWLAHLDRRNPFP